MRLNGGGNGDDEPSAMPQRIHNQRTPGESRKRGIRHVAIDGIIGDEGSMFVALSTPLHWASERHHGVIRYVNIEHRTRGLATLARENREGEISDCGGW